MSKRTEAKYSNAIITNIILNLYKSFSVLFDLGPFFSYISTYFLLVLMLDASVISTPFHVTTIIGNFLVVNQMYQSSVVTFVGYET